MIKVKVVEPNEGLAFLSLQTKDDNMVDIPLSYTQDITGGFIQEFQVYLLDKKTHGHLVLGANGSEGRYVLVADQEKSYVINKDAEEMTVCKASAKDIIKACMTNFVSYMDLWANFDIKDQPGNSVSYTRDFMDRKALLESAADELAPYLTGNRRV